MKFKKLHKKHPEIRAENANNYYQKTKKPINEAFMGYIEVIK